MANKKINNKQLKYKLPHLSNGVYGILCYSVRTCVKTGLYLLLDDALNLPITHIFNARILLILVVCFMGWIEAVIM